MIIKKIIKNIFKETINNLIIKKILPQFIRIEKINFKINLSKNINHGDFSCNVAMVLGKVIKKNPKSLASTLINNIIDKKHYMEKIEITEKGFINITISNLLLMNIIPDVINLKEKYGHNCKVNKNILIEFISANPTGPLHIGHARSAFLGDAIAKILKAAGFNVTKEFYINDTGNQIISLGESIYARYMELFGEKININKNNYPGKYIINIAKKLIEENGDKLINIHKEKWLKICIELGIKENLHDIKKDLFLAGINIDNWFSEKMLHEEGKIDELIKDYFKRNLLYYSSKDKIKKKIRRENSNASIYSNNQNGGIFLKTSKFGDKEDRVIIKKNGEFVYLISDLCYHKEKFSRKFDQLINIFGADHAGHIERIKSGMLALDISINTLSFITVQIVKLLKTGKEIKISKRNGEIYLLSDIIKEIGIDATKFIFLMRSANSQFNFDIDLVLKQNNDNPVFYIQYGHARMANLIKKANDLGLLFEEKELTLNILDKLTLRIEKYMLLKIEDFKNCINDSAVNLEPHRVIYYCQDLVANFHSYFTRYKYNEKIFSEDKELTKAKLWLIIALRQTLSNALSLLGINAPNYMKINKN